MRLFHIKNYNFHIEGALEVFSEHWKATNFKNKTLFSFCIGFDYNSFLKLKGDHLKDLICDTTKRIRFQIAFDSLQQTPIVNESIIINDDTEFILNEDVQIIEHDMPFELQGPVPVNIAEINEQMVSYYSSSNLKCWFSQEILLQDFDKINDLDLKIVISKYKKFGELQDNHRTVLSKSIIKSIFLQNVSQM